jgi:hypothetical protein
MPTDPTPDPTGQPTGAPSSRPTLFYATESPTAYLFAVNFTGTLQFHPLKVNTCVDTELIIKFTLGSDVRYGDTIRINTPGLTNGACLTKTAGTNNTDLLLANATDFNGAYTIMAHATHK